MLSLAQIRPMMTALLPPAPRSVGQQLPKHAANTQGRPSVTALDADPRTFKKQEYFIGQ